MSIINAPAFPEVEIIAPENINGHLLSTLHNFIRRTANLDDFGQYQLEDGVQRRVAKLHVTEAPLPFLPPYRPTVAGSEFPFEPYLAVEDEAGHMAPLKAAAPVVKTEAAYGVLLPFEGRFFVMHRPDWEENRALIGEGPIAEKGWNVVEIFDQHEFSLENVGPLSKMTGPADGEFHWTASERPIMTHIPWWSTMGVESFPELAQVLGQHLGREIAPEWREEDDPVLQMSEAEL